MKIGNISQENVVLLRSIASVAYGSREGWKGGAGNIGMVDGKVVKFNTHFAERRVGLTSEELGKMCEIGNTLRQALGDIAKKSLAADSADLSKIREWLGLNALNEVTGGADRKLLDRKVVAKVVTKLLDANDDEGVAKDTFLDESRDLARSSKDQDTSVAEFQRRQVYMDKNFNWSSPVDKGGPSHAIANTLASPDEKAAYTTRQTVYLNRIADGITHDLLMDQEFTQLFENDQNQPWGRYLKQQLLRDFSGCDAMEKGDCHVPEKRQGAVMDNIRKAIERSVGPVTRKFGDAKIGSGTIGQLTYPDLVQKVALENIKTWVTDALNAITLKCDKPPKYDANSSGLLLRGKEHPTLKDGFKDYGLGQFFTQNRNTCFMMSTINALMSTEKGRAHLQKVIPGDGTIKYVDNDNPKDVKLKSLNVNGIPPNSKFTEMERALFELYKMEDPTGGLGEIGFPGGLPVKIGYKDTGFIGTGLYNQGTSYSQRLKYFSYVAKALTEEKVCLLLRGKETDLVRHYMAIVDIYVNPEDPNDFGFWVKDSSKGNIRKIRAEYGGDTAYTFKWTLQSLVFEPDKDSIKVFDNDH